MKYSDNIIDVVSSSWILFHITRPLLTLEDQKMSQANVNMGFNQTQRKMQGLGLRRDGKNKGKDFAN